MSDFTSEQLMVLHYNEKQFKKHVGEVIREKRQSMKMSLEELSSLASISPGYLGLIERGKRAGQLSTLIRLCAALSCSISELIDIKELDYDESGPHSHAWQLLAHLDALNMNQSEDMDFVIEIVKSVAIYKSKAVCLND